jgi:hypothetical protein
MVGRLSKVGAFALAAAMLLSGCGNDDFLGENLGDAIGLQDPMTGLVDGLGNIITSVDIGDPITIQVPRLASDTQYVIRITDANGVEYNPADGILATANEQGTIYQSTVVQNLDSRANNAAVLAPPGDYSISIRRTSGALVKTLDFEVLDKSRVYCSDGTGSRRASFQATQDVFVTVERAGGMLSDGNYDVHVVSDLNVALPNGGGLPDATTNVTVNGGVGIANLGMFASGAWDIVVDLDDDGFYTQDTDLISRHRRLHACFTVQSANTGAPLVEQIGADREGNHREVFDPLADQAEPVADVHARVTGSEASVVQEALGVAKYIVQHQDVWTTGDPLTDVTQAVEIDPVQDFSISEAPWLVWPRQNLVAGCYDVVIDVNRNGLFDAGTDLVDNIDEVGATTCGVRIADTACTGNVQITNQETVFQTLDTAIPIAGTVAAGALGGSVTIASGVQTNTLTLPPGTTINVTVPLFNGVNYVTIAFEYPGDQTCASTMVVTQGFDFNSLFRVQLVWDGDTDMDLHLVRPGGAYENGGGGEDDCNFENCNVGLQGTGTNTIDWGNAGEDDDPKLDVDCIACGAGIENIWMSEINQNGDYTVYVDAFNGSETGVTTKIFIGGALVGEVNCGDMVAGSATDSCRAGVIRWNGNSGAFIPDGTLANDF